MLKKLWMYYALAATLTAVVAIRGWHRAHQAETRLSANQQALHTLLDNRQQQLDTCHASIEALRLNCHELKQLRQADADTIRRLGIRLRRLQAAARQVTTTRLDLHMPLRDTVRIVRRDTLSLLDTLRHFTWRDPWVCIQGAIHRDSVHCHLQSTDTLRQLLHRVPRRFLFFRWGTKAVRQELYSSNPHTRIVYADYLLIER